MSRIPSAFHAGWLCLGLLFAPSFLLAAGKDGPVTYALKLKPNPDIAGGQIAIIQNEVGKEPDHYVVENLSILQPVEVVLIAKDPGDELKIQLCKHLWTQPEREGSTQGTGSVRFAFRTEGDLRIQVSAPSGNRGYQLAVWAGDALKRPLPSAFVPMEKARGGAMAWLGSPVL
jgi:hypothetical protein